jgi:hypothetical protein
MEKLTAKQIVGFIIVLFSVAVWFMLGGRETTKPTIATKTKTDPSTSLVEARTQIERTMKEVAVGDEEAQKLFEFFKARGFVGMFKDRNFNAEKGASPEMVQGNIPLSQSRFLIIPIAPSERQLRNLPSAANFFYESKANMVYVPPLETFTRNWFGARALHEVSHVFDRLEGNEPEPGEVLTEDFINGEIRAHKLEIRLLNLRTNNQLLTKIRSVASKMAVPKGFPDNEIDSDAIRFEEIDILFSKPLSAEEDNTRKGSYFIALNFAMAEIMGLGEKGQITFLAGHFKKRDNVRQ